MSSKDCEIILEMAKSLPYGLNKAKALIRAAYCFRDSKKLKEAVDCLKDAYYAATSVSKHSSKHYYYALRSLVEGAKLSFQIGDYKSTVEFLDHLREIIQKRPSLYSENEKRVIKALEVLSKSIINLDEYQYFEGLKLLCDQKTRIQAGEQLVMAALSAQPPYVRILRKIPEIVNEAEPFLVEIELTCENKDVYEVNVCEDLLEDFQVVDGMTSWAGDVPAGKKMVFSYRLKAKKFGEFAIKPTQVTYKTKVLPWINKTFKLTGEPFKIKVLPTKVKIHKKLSTTKTDVNNEVGLYISVINESEKDIYDLEILDNIPDKNDFEYVGSHSFTRKQLLKGETRTFEAKIIPKTRGNFLLGPAVMKFKDVDGCEFEIKSNDWALKVASLDLDSQQKTGETSSSKIFEEVFAKLEQLDRRIKVFEEKLRMCSNCGALMVDPKARFCGVCGEELG